MSQNDQSIQPALTPEEWALVGNGRLGALNDLVERWDRENLAFVIALANHALPDGDPRKITREDVAWLYTLTTDVDNGNYQIFASDVTCLRFIAAKLAALLPPK